MTSTRRLGVAVVAVVVAVVVVVVVVVVVAGRSGRRFVAAVGVVVADEEQRRRGAAAVPTAGVAVAGRAAELVAHLGALEGGARVLEPVDQVADVERLAAAARLQRVQLLNEQLQLQPRPKTTTTTTTTLPIRLRYTSDR